jgi:hypothetical protein
MTNSGKTSNKKDVCRRAEIFSRLIRNAEQFQGCTGGGIFGLRGAGEARRNVVFIWREDA